MFKTIKKDNINLENTENLYYSSDGYFRLLDDNTFSTQDISKLTDEVLENKDFVSVNDPIEDKLTYHKKYSKIFKYYFIWRFDKESYIKDFLLTVRPDLQDKILNLSPNLYKEGEVWYMIKQNATIENAIAYGYLRKLISNLSQLKNDVYFAQIVRGNIDKDFKINLQPKLPTVLEDQEFYPEGKDLLYQTNISELDINKEFSLQEMLNQLDLSLINENI